MKTFKNKNFIKRDYECTNVVFCQGESAPNDNYIEVDELDLDLFNGQHLYTQANVRYFGYL